MLNTINILTIDCEPIVILALANRPAGWRVKYNIKSITGIDKRVIAAGAWDVILYTNGADRYAEFFEAVKAPVVVLTNVTDYRQRERLLDMGAARCYSMEDIVSCLFILHHVIDNVVREEIKDRRLEYLQSAALAELRNLISECANCHRWRDPSTDEFIEPMKFLEKFQIYLTSGLCPECRETLYGHLEAKAHE